MATYKVQDNGKAQKGLKTGDKVVTAGGTYQITGVKADGSYESKKVSGTTTSNYTGTYANASNKNTTANKNTASGTGKKNSGSSLASSWKNNPGTTSSTKKNSQYTKTNTSGKNTESASRHQSQAGYSMPNSAAGVGIYMVGADGKAPAGLKAGDKVVTAGGTYRITGVNPDGTYQSQLANQSQTTANYKGTYANATNPNRGTAAKDTNNDGYITTYDATGVLGMGQLTGKTIPDDYVILQVGTSGKNFIAVPKSKEKIYQSMIDRSNNGGAKISSANFENSREVITLSEADAIAAGIPTYHSRMYGITAEDLVGAQVGAGTPNKILADAGLTGTNSWDNPLPDDFTWTPNASGVSTFNGFGYDYTPGAGTSGDLGGTSGYPTTGYPGGTGGFTYPDYSGGTGSGYTGDGGTGGYDSGYSAQIDALLDSILSRDGFSYNVEEDDLYQQYKKRYNREGARALDDTLAAAASGAGGMNSYAMTAAQQANNYYASQVADKIPELYQLAYDMYLTDLDSQVRDLGLLQRMDDTQYSRYRDTMSDWRDDRDFAYGVYRDDVGDRQWERNFNYSAYRDALADSRYDQEWAYSVGRDEVSDSRYDQEWEWQLGLAEREDAIYDSETAYNRAMDMLLMGVMPNDDILSMAGITATEARAIQAANTQTATYRSSGGGGNSYTPIVTDSYTPTVTDTDSTTLSASAQNRLKSLEKMKSQTGSKQAIANTIAVYADSGKITDAEARLMFKHFGYDPDEWLE